MALGTELPTIVGKGKLDIAGESRTGFSEIPPERRLLVAQSGPGYSQRLASE
jgi:hypothetical protein